MMFLTFYRVLMATVCVFIDVYW